MKTIATLAAALSALTLAACGQTPAMTSATDQSAEKAGEAADTQFEQATQGSTDLTDGPLENAGEAIDQARENATDGAPATPATTTP